MGIIPAANSRDRTPSDMSRRRTIYFDDARHFYLWNFEPPMDLRDAWVPVDQVAGTAAHQIGRAQRVEPGDQPGTEAPVPSGEPYPSFRVRGCSRTGTCIQE